jgi:GTPase
MSQKRKGLVALVGRPNVGKSTLFNRLVGKRLAVVSEIPGTTRDRIYADGEWIGTIFTVVDTGGIEVIEGWHTEPLSEDSDQFMEGIRSQAQVAIQDADVIVHVVDGRAGLTAADREVANILRQTDKPVVVAANKLDDVVRKQNEALEFYELGVGEVFAISALHGRGTGDLLDEVVAHLPQFGEDDQENVNEDDIIRVAILGKPNAGKSTLFNKLIGQERVIVSPIAGTTRDAIDTDLTWHGQKFTLIDTAGIRRRGKIDPGVEKYSVIRALRALRRADVALLLIDAVADITAQDQHIAGMMKDENASMVVLVNKWDAIEKDNHTMQEYSARLQRELNFLPYVPILYISAMTGQRTQKIFETVLEVNEARHKRISTAELNRFLREVTAKNPPPSRKGQPLKMLYATQVSVAPPTFVFFVNKAELVHFTYQRFLENQLRERYPFPGTPIRLLFRGREVEEER